MSDLISRQAAIDNLKRHLNETDVPDSYPGIFNAIEEWLSDWEVPSAKPDSKESSLTQKALDIISRQDAIDAVKKHYRIDNDLLELIAYEIEQLPSAEPEVIRCKDCKNADHDAIFDDLWCDGREVSADHYCGLAERKCDGQ